LSLWVAPFVLVAVAGIGVAGRVGPPAVRQVPVPSPAVDEVVRPPVGLGGAADPGEPRAAPGVPFQPARHDGTDGLMGGIPFDLPADAPPVAPDRVNRFTIDDVALGWSGGATVPTRLHRIGGLPAYTADPGAL
jgi:hypothetical protein